jgi:copper homeostasis protein
MPYPEPMPIFEVCTDSLAGVMAARDAGAHRAELCSSVDDGGITPSIGLIELACEVGIPVHVLVRPRAGNFVYSSAEMRVMLRDLEAIKNAGAAGAVIGVLERDGQLDLERTRELIAASRPMSVTFHRAFDVCNDPTGVLEQLIGLGVDRVLTSGQEPTALEGAAVIQKLNHQARGRIVVMAGGGIRAHNVKRVLLETGVTEIHFTARESLAAETSSPPSFGAHRETTQAEIKRLISNTIC